jgi:alpha-D-ribose 1-methylphosphonate 5-triphosphate diphosphatase
VQSCTHGLCGYTAIDYLETLSFRNANVVAPEAIVRATVRVENGLIAGIDDSDSSSLDALDLGGDYLLPGLIEVHTDNLERHVWPRPGVEWNIHGAVLSHDLELAGAGITTAYDAVSIGDALASKGSAGLLRSSIAAITGAHANGVMRAEHRIHLRCELSDPLSPDVFAELVDEPLVGLVSVMDHTPGQRQWTDLERFRSHYGGRYGLAPAELDEFIQTRMAHHLAYSESNRHKIVALCRRKNIRMASHDDATASHVQTAGQDGVSIAEFPTTLEAAREARRIGQAVVMGAPNLLRGRSHSGNVSAGELMQVGCVNILSSDYCPSSLIQAVFMLPNLMGIGLARAVAFASSAPAEALGLVDRGQIAIGKRADMVRVRQTPYGPSVRAVWRNGHRVV